MKHKSQIKYFIFNASSCVSCEFMIGEGGGGNHMSQSINKQVRILPAVKPEAHFLKVGL
jgi:hypothetical protein